MPINIKPEPGMPAQRLLSPHPSYPGWFSFRPLVEFQPRISHGQRSIDIMSLRHRNRSVQGSAEVLNHAGHAALCKSQVARSALPGKVWANCARTVCCLEFLQKGMNRLPGPWSLMVITAPQFSKKSTYLSWQCSVRQMIVTAVTQ